jgi:hypothetical protein
MSDPGLLHVLDGNAIAGILKDAFGREMTRAGHTCPRCNHTNMLGGHRLYRSAGYVLRCPNCDAAAISVVVIESSQSTNVTVSGLLHLADEPVADRRVGDHGRLRAFDPDVTSDISS